MKIVTILGARPQFIKASVVSKALSNFSNSIEEIIVHTGQHYDKNMSQVFFDEMQIFEPKYNLNLGSLSHGAMTGRMIEGIEKILIKEKPDWVMVYGDTNSTLAGALAAVKLQIKIAHIESGLRSFNMKMPEEINRILTDRMSNLLFISSKEGQINLINEGILKQTQAEVVFSGDVMYDTILNYMPYAKQPSIALPEKFALATIHRQENTDHKQTLINIINQLNQLHLTLPVVIPLHPRTKKIIDQLNVPINFLPISSASYFEMLYLLKNCSIVITDSGGLQKEAYFCKKQCVTIRNETEWVELVNYGANKLVDPLSDKLAKIVLEELDKNISVQEGIYGDGQASNIIANTFHAQCSIT